MSPANMIGSRHLRLLTLAGAGAAVVQAAHENPFIGQQFLIIDRTFEPYELPPNKSTEIFAKVPTRDAKFPIQGYNIFTPAPGEQSVPEAVEGWQIEIKLTTDISLEGADPLFLDEDIPNTNKTNSNEEDDLDEDLCEDYEENLELDDLRNQVFDAVLVSLLPPKNLVSTGKETSLNDPGGSNDTVINQGPGVAAGSTGWTVCAAVWVTGLSMDDSTRTGSSALASPSSQDRSSNTSSSCAGLVSEQCITDMIAEFNLAPGGNCKNRTLPSSCHPAFAGQDGGLDAVNLAQVLTDDSNDIFTSNTPIFAASTYPRRVEGNRTAEALRAVSDWIFPIIMSWTPPGGGATQSHLSCVGINKALEAKAPSVTSGDGPSPVVVNSGAGSNYRVRAWGLFALIGGVVSISGCYNIPGIE